MLRITVLHFLKSLEPRRLETKSRMKFVFFLLCIRPWSPFGSWRSWLCLTGRKVSQPQNCGHLGPDHPSLGGEGKALGTADCWTQALASTHQMWGAPLPHKLWQWGMSPNNCHMFSRGQNCPWLRTSGVRWLHSGVLFRVRGTLGTFLKVRSSYWIRKHRIRPGADKSTNQNLGWGQESAS